MSVFDVFKRKACMHPDFPENRIHGITAYVFECPRCKKKIMYCKINNTKSLISNRTYKEYIEFVTNGGGAEW